MQFRVRLSLHIDVKSKICREGRAFLKQNIVARDRILILISGFFYFASPTDKRGKKNVPGFWKNENYVIECR